MTIIMMLIKKGLIMVILVKMLVMLVVTMKILVVGVEIIQDLQSSAACSQS